MSGVEARPCDASSASSAVPANVGVDRLPPLARCRSDGRKLAWLSQSSVWMQAFWRQWRLSIRCGPSSRTHKCPLNVSNQLLSLPWQIPLRCVFPSKVFAHDYVSRPPQHRTCHYRSSKRSRCERISTSRSTGRGQHAHRACTQFRRTSGVGSPRRRRAKSGQRSVADRCRTRSGAGGSDCRKKLSRRVRRYRSRTGAIAAPRWQTCCGWRANGHVCSLDAAWCAGARL